MGSAAQTVIATINASSAKLTGKEKASILRQYKRNKRDYGLRVARIFLSIALEGPQTK